MKKGFKAIDFKTVLFFCSRKYIISIIHQVVTISNGKKEKKKQTGNCNRYKINEYSLVFIRRVRQVFNQSFFAHRLLHADFLFPVKAGNRLREEEVSVIQIFFYCFLKRTCWTQQSDAWLWPLNSFVTERLPDWIPRGSLLRVIIASNNTCKYLPKNAWPWLGHSFYDYPMQMKYGKPDFLRSSEGWVDYPKLSRKWHLQMLNKTFLQFSKDNHMQKINDLGG